jgi:hypothetical protein
MEPVFRTREIAAKAVEGAFWVPRRLGGSAPTVAEAKIIEETEKAERARRRAEHGP